jgi:natural product biosynthesis luciferase-like monooxygenase protein
MNDTRFSCFLIGADTLLMECGDVLLERGHDVRGVVTGAPRVEAWARENGLEVIDVSGDWAAALAAEPFDHLFAITHLAIIPDEVLSLPQGLGINFHDGPLPGYAGLNTPVWALLAGEDRHGVTWHELTSGIDAGDVLARVEFDIAPDETALSLNTKCMVAALESFPDLVEALETGTVTRTPQDTSGRRYFGRRDRPSPAGLIDWTAPTVEVLRFVRGLTFGPYPNPLGIPKTCRADGEALLLVDAAEDGGDARDAAADASAGSVLEVGDAGIRVATSDGSVRITEARDGDGAPLDAAAWRGAGLDVGAGLAVPGTPAFDQAARLSDDVARAEPFWERRLRGSESPQVAQAVPAGGGEAGGGEFDHATVPVVTPGGVSVETLAAAWAVYLARTGRTPRFTLEVQSGGPENPLLAGSVPLPVDLEPGWTLAEVAADLGRGLADVATRPAFWRDLPLRSPDLVGRRGRASLSDAVGFSTDGVTAPGTLVTLSVDPQGSGATLHYDRTRLGDVDARTIADCVARLADAAMDTPWTTAPMLSPEEQDRILLGWNDSEREWPSDQCIHEAFEAQVDRTPDRRAVVCGEDVLSYRELDERANALAARLAGAGVERGGLVGVHVARSVELLVATLGVLKAGAAYVPLDPDFPADRIALMVADSSARVIVTQPGLADALPETPADLLLLDGDSDRSPQRPGRTAEPRDPAYVIYTSGSTGRPKGVLVEHRNVGNFFAGMDEVVEPASGEHAHGRAAAWLAVTSLSFDISVLELFWTLARGFTVVIYDDPRPGGALDAAERASASRVAAETRPIDFGLFMWGNDDGPGPQKYRLMMEGARYFDTHGFHSVWTPERHFHAFGGPFPNPSVTGAAIAAVTENVAIRSGSCVSPLHHPVRVAEEWSVVDNLSDGRVGLAFASGWQPHDFVLRPENFGRQKDVMFEQIDLVRRLWRGETVEFESPAGGTAPIRTLPRPVQDELPFWVTTAGNPETYAQAGRIGANVLTHLLGQSLEEVAEKIRIYREARSEVGLDPEGGNVTLMLHTFVGDDDDRVREIVRQPMKDYLGASMKLVLGFAWTFPAFKRPGQAGAEPEDIDLGSLSEEESDAILEFAFERYYETSGLFGTPETCIEMVGRCKAIGVDEIACLLDFGVDTDAVLESLPLLERVKDATARPTAPAERPAAAPGAEASAAQARPSFSEQIAAHGVTHLQCTPSMARLILADADARPGLRELAHLMVGGEAFPVALANELSNEVAGRITNMYGPTETTIWSSTHEVVPGEDPMPIGRPIANTRLYVLDPYLNPLPAGIPGELFIGGEGVARGYHERPDLTAERFLPDPFTPGGRTPESAPVGDGDGAYPRMYRTGDLVCFRRDGVLDFLGRVDRQVKFRGYRIELGEIEAVLDGVDGVTSAAVLLREDGPDASWLVAYVVGDDGPTEESTLRAHLRARLPEYMVPSRIVRLDRMPLTPNGKIDRRALPAPRDEHAGGAGAGAEPHSDLERTIADCWRRVLQIERVGVEDNFFDIGGHSLLVVQLHRLLTDHIEQELSLVDLYRFPTIRRLVDHLDEAGGGEALDDSIRRARQRRDALQRRRGRG